MNEPIVRYEGGYRPSDAVLVLGLPGVGHAAKIATEHVGSQMKAEIFARLYSSKLPAAVFVDETSVVHMPRIDFWHADAPDGRDIVFVTGDFQPVTADGQFELCGQILDLASGWGLSKIVTMGGVVNGGYDGEPDVITAASDETMVREAVRAGAIAVPHEPGGGIIGAAGMLLGLGQVQGVDSTCLIAECNGYIYDFRAAASLIKVLRKLLGLKGINTRKLRNEAARFDELTNRASRQNVSPDNDHLTYIGRPGQPFFSMPGHHHPMPLGLGIDTGGTYTDSVITDMDTGRIVSR